MDSKLTFMVAGFGLLLTFPTVVDDMGFFERTPTSPSPAVETASPPSFVPETPAVQVPPGGD